MDSIVLPTDFDASNITYSEPRVLDNNGKVIYVSYNKKKLIMQTPEMDVPFGLSKQSFDGKDKYSLDLSFKGKDNREVLGKFFNGLKSLDRKFIEDGFANSQKWFKKTFKSIDSIEEAMYTPLVKFPKDKEGNITDKYPPTIRITVPHDGTKFLCDVYDHNKNIVDLATIDTKGAKISAIVQCSGLWVSGKYGSTWKVVQMKVTPPARIKGYAFKDIEEKVEKDIDEEDEDDIDNDEDAKDCLEHAQISGQEETVVETDDEDDLEVKPKPTVKRVVKK